VKTSTPGLWFVPAGHLPPNPAELLGSTRFRDFLGSLRDHFDWVIIDTPPVMAVTDASVIAHRVSGVVFIVGAEMISRQHAAVALEQLQHAHAKILGAVLNRVDVDRNALYYSPYYRKEYVDYYQKPRVAARIGVADKV
jgi:capsular exopolysaccharide synthesis family protein